MDQVSSSQSALAVWLTWDLGKFVWIEATYIQTKETKGFTEQPETQPSKGLFQCVSFED